MRNYWNGSSTQLSLGHANSLREWGIAGMEAQPINSPARRQPTRPGQQNHRAKGKQKLTKTNLSIKSGVASIPLSCGTPARRDNCINNYKKKMIKLNKVKLIRIKMIESSSFIASSLGLGDCHEVTNLCEKL
jgi:hypothetical protein